MKVFVITPGEELLSVYDGVGQFGDAGWYIELRSNEETWEDEIWHNAFLKIANVQAYIRFSESSAAKFYKLQEVVDIIWSESSDVKDFAKRLYDARISDRFFEEVEFDEEETE